MSADPMREAVEGFERDRQAAAKHVAKLDGGELGDIIVGDTNAMRDLFRARVAEFVKPNSIPMGGPDMLRGHVPGSDGAFEILGYDDGLDYIRRGGEDRLNAVIATLRAQVATITRADALDLITDANACRQRAILSPEQAEEELARAARYDDLAARLAALVPTQEGAHG